ncbi:MAG: phosphatase PAP2 family protein [Bacteroidaceae bacterium]|nr:phosphatase PAP2 family protein [Bacteroidaceae bacterium]
MTERLIELDKTLLLALNGSESLFLDGVMWTVTRTATWLLFFAALLYVLFRQNQLRPALLMVAVITLLVLTTDQVSSHLFKPLFHRPRPTHNWQIGQLVDVVRGYRAGPYGFISSHAANTFGVAMFLSLVFRRRAMTCLLFLWALLCSYSRIYLGVHYPGDIAAGASFGLLVGYLYYLLLGWVLSSKVCKVLSARLCRLDLPRTLNSKLSALNSLRIVSLSLLLTFIYICVKAYLFHP